MTSVKYLYIMLLALLPLPGLHASAQDDGSGFDRLVAEAQAAQSAGNFQAAADAYQEAAALNPGIPELWANLGLMQHQAGHHDDAISSFRKSWRLNSHLFVPNLFLGIDLVEEQHYEEALAYLLRARQLDPADLQGALALGRAYAGLREPLKASDAYGAAIRMDSKNADAWFGLGVMALERVEEDARVLIAKYKSSAFVDALSAEALEDQHKPAEAAAYFAKAIAAPTTPLCIRTQYALVLEQQHENEQAKALLQREMGACPLTRLVVQGGVRAESDYQLSPGTRASGEDLVRASTQEAGTAPPARDACAAEEDVAKHINPGTGPSEMRAPFCFYSRNYWGASIEARQMQSTAATEPAGLYWEIRAQQRLAVLALNRAGEEAPDSAQMHVLLGDIQRQHNHLNDAQNEYKKALALKPDDPGALLGIGVTRFLANDLTGALDAGKVLLASSPEDPATNLLVAESLMALHRDEEAKPYLDRSLKVQPEMLPRVHALLGRYYADAGADEKAINELTLALSGDNDGNVHYQLALLYRKKGDKANAARLFEASRQLHTAQLERATIAFQEVTQPNNTATN